MSAVAASSDQATQHDQAAARVAPASRLDRLVSQPTVIAATLALDFVTVIAAGVATFVLWLEGSLTGGAVMAMALVAACVPVVLKSRWAYTIPALSSLANQLAELALALFVAISGLMIVNMVAGVDVAPLRAWTLHWYLFALAACLAERFVLTRMLANWSKAGRMARRTIIVGGGKPTFDLIERWTGPARTPSRSSAYSTTATNTARPNRSAATPSLGASRTSRPSAATSASTS